MTDNTIYDAIVEEAAERFAKGEASDGDKIVLLQSRQCGKLDEIARYTKSTAEKVDEIHAGYNWVKNKVVYLALGLMVAEIIALLGIGSQLF